MNAQSIPVSSSRLLDSLLSTPHRAMDHLVPLHGSAIVADPVFYGHLAVWYSKNGQVRDHSELFLCHLLASEETLHREIGGELLQEMAPHQIARVIDFLKRKIGKTPRSTRTAVVRYLRKREDDPQVFDKTALRHKKSMKTLYASLHIKPGERADLVLFKNQPPEDSLAYWVKQLAAADPSKQADIIRAHNIPWAIGIGAVTDPECEVYSALVANMTEAELINNLKAVKNRGLLNHPQIGDLIRAKLNESGGNVAAYKPAIAASFANLGAEFELILKRLTDRKVKKFGRLHKPTALLVDKSQSMENAIAIGTRLAAMVSGITHAPLRVYAFDGEAVPVNASGLDASHWEKAFEGIKAQGCTSLGIGLEAAARTRFYMEQVVLVSDMKENTPPYFLPAYKDYSKKMGVKPQVVLLQLNKDDNSLEKELMKEGVPTRRFNFTGDYYSLPNLIPFLVQPCAQALYAEVLNTPLPVRRDLSE